MEPNNISDEFFYGTCIPILNLLVKRINPNHLDGKWCRRISASNDEIKYSCKICCEEFSGKLSDDEEFFNFINRVKCHGIFHLKERNLLPFI